MSDQSLSLCCSCGKELPVRFQDAGSSLKCSCGNYVSVPTLGKLRQLAGKEAYVTNPVEAIQQQINRNISPAGSECLICHSPDSPQHTYLAICESMYTKNAESNSSNDIAVLMGKILFIFAAPRLLLTFLLGSRSEKEVKHFGRDVSVEITLPICQACVSSGNSPKKLRLARKWMKQVPLYKELLQTYPDLKLKLQ